MFNQFNLHSLFWKLTLPIVLTFAITIAALSIYIPDEIEQRAIESAKVAAGQTAKQFKQLRKYYVNNVLKKVKANSDIKGAIDHKNNPNAIPLPATMIHDLSEALKAEGTTVNLYSAHPFPNRKSRILDNFQQEAWDYLSKNPNTQYVQKMVKDGKNIVRVAVADTMVADACVQCHNSHPDTPKIGWQLGDVRGILEISSDITAQVAASAATGTKIVLAMLFSLVLTIAILSFVYKAVIAKKLHELDSAIKNLTDGSSDLTRRLDDSGKDEISGVARGFNGFLENHRLFIKEIFDSAQHLSHSTKDMAMIASEAKEHSSRQKNGVYAISCG